MHIRDVTDGDFDAIAQLTNHYIERSTIHFGTQPVSAAELRAEWAKNSERYAFLVADLGGFAGFAKSSSFRARSAYASTAEVSVYVHVARQRRGVARALYHQLIDVSRRRGLHTLVAAITLPNEPSLALHERMGFAPVGVFKEVGAKFGGHHDVAFWQLMLAGDP